jgi:hypothetical protein
MSYFFDVYGPFGVDRSDGQIKRAGQSMWAQTEAQDEGLAKSWGCYVFCIQNGKNVVPWYVGKTWAEGGFRAEVFGDHKLDLYNWCSEWKGQRTMLLVPLMTGGQDDVGQFSSNKGSHSVISWLERTLIGRALDRNPELLNIRDTKLLRSVTVRGVMGSKSRL